MARPPNNDLKQHVRSTPSPRIIPTLFIPLEVSFSRNIQEKEF
jgi:hypothetical protein